MVSYADSGTFDSGEDCVCNSDDHDIDALLEACDILSAICVDATDEQSHVCGLGLLAGRVLDLAGGAADV